ncbi:TetR/AcrR family transcriptional regulator [Plantactinospora sonchi]|uniref:TetR/AcrR family transcriptional regulator n=1 Tax=Plantactinospora sonchi TaxID=1544735 RepID=A0ABU7RWG2_9ACTN
MSGTRPSVKRPRAPRAPGERPGQILDAATRVLLRDGLDATTIDGIAAEAGLGKGTVYEYFGSKAQVFTALRRRCNERILAAGTDAVAAAPGTAALDRVRRFVTGMVGFWVANPRLVALLFHEAGIEEPDELGPIKESLRQLVREGVRTGELAVEDPTFTVEFLLHGLHGVLEGLFNEGAAVERVAAEGAAVERVAAEGAAAEQVLARVDGVLTALLKPTRPAG